MPPQSNVKNLKIEHLGGSIHWEELDEDLGLEGFFSYNRPFKHIEKKLANPLA
jgi:hypothetical protein